jgi:hypothetical protein
MSRRCPRVTVLALLVVALPGVAIGQGVEPDAAKVEAMQRISFMEGDWAGGGWIALGPEGRRSFRGTEHVEMRLGGTVMLVEGRHWSASDGDSDGALVHHAFAVVSAAADGGYSFQSWLVNRDGGIFSGRFEEGAFIWGMSTPRGEMRYIIRLDDQGRWHEIGEWQGEDGEWRQFFEMTLTKQ